MANKKIIPRDEDFAKWYTSIVTEADLIDYWLIKGTVILKPYGWSIWKQIENNLDPEFKKIGVQNCALPMLIPLSEFEREKEHVEGFAPELFTITKIGETELESPCVLRPTSEIIFCHYFKNNVYSYNNLPMLLNQWCNVFRAEKNTRPFLRTSEFFWHEQHSVFAEKQEAIDFAYEILDIYKKFFRDVLYMPVIVGQKTEHEKFAGAEFTLTLESIMQDGQALQCGTSHYLGQNFSKSFDMKFQNKDNGFSFMEQTSAGVSTRLIGGLIMVHSDDDGLVLPSKIAPIQVMINSSWYEKSNEVQKTIKDLEKELMNLRIASDISDKSLGLKIGDGQVKGIPLQINVLPKLLEESESIEIFDRSTNEKKHYKLKDINEKFILEYLTEYDERLYTRAERNL